ncbi:MAG: GNAT family N-acetyltransferase [Methylophilaceae bacterium]
MSLEIAIATSFSQIDAGEWDAISDGSPVLSHVFLSTMEDAHCVGEGTGWQPYPIIVRESGVLVGAAPLYLKSHSYGEYVFDWSWADAYERSGLSYYPKLLVAIPFTPVTGARLLGSRPEVQTLLVRVLEQQMQEHDLSSAHVLFTDDASSDILQQAGWMLRDGVQFRWENDGFNDFEDFLSRLAHDKRKKIRQERKKIINAGVTCKQLTGNEISETDWDFFFQCYEHTYHEHRSTPYLNRQFFRLLSERMPENILLILAEREGNPIAAALNFYDEQALYGRYWGAMEYVPALHFELCYYQAQAFCIAQGIRYFEGGAQGEHKLARGFLPRATRSYHKIAHTEFEAAIKEYVRRESRGMAVYNNELEERAPYKHLDDIP